jgi:hypothetical protein
MRGGRNTVPPTWATGRANESLARSRRRHDEEPDDGNVSIDRL